MRIPAYAYRLAGVLSFWAIQGMVYAQSSASSEGNMFGELTKPRPLRLLVPFGNVTEFAPQSNINILYTYFNTVWPWVIGCAAGVAVLQALYGGILIMLSGGKEQKEEGKSKILWALAGLLMVGLSGVILETLNPLFFVQP